MSFFGKTDVQGVLYFAVALFFTTSLLGYHPLDPSLNTLGQEPIQNYCGYIGAFLSDFVYQIFGLGAWCIVVFILKKSFLAFSGRRSSNFQTYMAEIILLCSVCSFLALFLPEERFFQGRIKAGGLSGELILSGLSPLIHTSGLVILLTSSLFCCLISLSHRPFRFYLKNGFQALNLFFFKLPKYCSSLIKIFWKKNKAIELPPVVFDQESKEIEIDDFEPSSFSQDTETPLNSDASWEIPSPSLLPHSPKASFRISNQEIQKQTQKLQDKLAQFSITGKMVGIKSGPAVTLFEFRPADSVKVGKITSLAEDLSMALSAESLRIIAPIPGRDVVGIEASNSSREPVYFRDLVKDPLFQNHKWDLPLIMGKYVDGSTCIQELSSVPHLLVAGSTGSGKSVFISSLLSGLLMHHSPETLRLILVDPKQVDLNSFSEIPHLLFPPIVQTSKALDTLHWVIKEMNKRYRSLNQFHARGLKSFNHTVSLLNEEEKDFHKQTLTQDLKDYYFKPLPYICIIVEEFGDLMASPKKIQIEQAVVRLAQMARACGIHLILAMQSPRKDVITGLIKTNIPGRISFKVSSKIDSRVILDESGAERLLAKGDMLFLAPGSAKTKRCHGPFINEDELLSIVQFWKNQGQPQYETLTSLENENFDIHSSWSDSSDEDMEKYMEIRSYVTSLKTISTSSLQRKFRLGYPRAARIMEKFEEEGVVGPAQGSKPREVLHHK